MKNIRAAGEDADTLLVYTSRSAQQIIRSGGSGTWKLDPARARKMKWLVCVQNRRNDRPYFDGHAPLNSAFLLGKISGVQPAMEADDITPHWRVMIDEAAAIDYRDMWDGKRAATRYTTLADLGINPNQKFEKVNHHVEPASVSSARVAPTTSTQSSVAQTIANAKATLAAELGVDPSAVEIIVHW